MIGRRERIRTSGPYVPNVVLYQAELLSEPVRKGRPLASGGALIAMPPRPRNRPDRRYEHIVRAGFSRFAGGGPCRYTGPPAPVCGLLGRRQVVRHWILIPAFEGSIPSAPARPVLKHHQKGSPAARAGSRRSPLSQVHRTCSPAARAAPHPFRPSQTRPETPSEGLPGRSRWLAAFAAFAGPPDLPTRCAGRASPLPPQPDQSGVTANNPPQSTNLANPVFNGRASLAPLFHVGFQRVVANSPLITPSLEGPLEINGPV